MSIMKSLLAIGLGVAAVSAVKADPVVKLLPGGAKSGGTAVLTVYGKPDTGAGLTAVVLTLNYDAAKITGNPTVAASAGWAPTTNFSAGQAKIAVTSSDGQFTAGPIFTVSFVKADNSAVPLTVDVDPSNSSFADDSFNTFSFPAGAGSVLLPGATRNLGGAITGSPSAGLSSVAVVAGNALRLLKKDDLTDLNGTGAALTAGISGRPSFGAIAGQAVVAVGTTDGKVSVFDASTGAAVGAAVTVGTSASSPAITADGTIYVAASNGTSASLVKVAGATTTPWTIPGNAIKSDVAVFGGFAVVATDAGVTTVRLDTGAPQATVADAAIVTSPVLDGKGAGVISSASKLYGINTSTGAVDAGTAAATLSSEGFLAADGIYFGDTTGAVAKFAAGALTTTPFLSKPITAQPLVIGGKIYAADNSGNVKAGSADAIALGGATTKALAATGTTAADSLVVAMPEGVIAELPL
ncbi:MAG TPA: hypothetical protein VGM37_12435 [Armatimonadota bacterium]